MPNWTECKVGGKVQGQTVIACPQCGKPCILGSRYPRSKGGFIQMYYHETKVSGVGGMQFNHVKKHCTVITD